MSAPVQHTTRRRENTRAQIVAAAAEVFADKGVAAATVDDLVAAAGYTRGAFYSNFSTKEEVFYELYDTLAETLLAQARTVLAEASPLLEAPDPARVGCGLEDMPDLLDVVREALHPYGRQWYLLQTEYALLALRNEDARAGFVRHRRRFRRQLGELLVEVLAACGRRPVVPADELAESVAALYLTSLELASLGEEELAQALESGEDVGAPAPSSSVYRVLLDGLSEPAGPA